MKKALLSLLLVTVVAFVWAGWPVYQFFSHRGAVPMLPTGFVQIPLTGPTHSQIDNKTYQRAGEQALQRLQERRQKILAPGISAAVAIKGERVWAGTVGWADIAKEQPVTADTQFRIGSTSKPVTITALAKLVERGLIDLDTPIGEYLSPLPNPAWTSITPRQLASHSAGLVEYKQTQDLMGLYHIMALRKRYDTAREALEIFDDSDLLFTPGSNFHYTSYSTVLLSAVMEAVTDTPLPALMQSMVFAPLNLAQTLPEPIKPPKHLASFYWRDGRQAKIWRKVDLSHRLAGGGYISTPSDLVTLGSAWLDPDVIAPELRDSFWQPQALPSGDINSQNYALGWRLHKADDYMPTHANHGGVSRGSQSWLMVIPDFQMAVAVSINSNTDVFWDFGETAVEIARHFMALEDNKTP
ncbi:MAG TPA: serine hydrolase domain-containing protein [Cellvibrionaceae bacterium]